MRTLSQQELAAVSGGTLFGLLPSVKVSVIAGPVGAVCIAIKTFLANVTVNVTWNGGASACGCGSSTPTTPTTPTEPEIN